ncbi:hypothetical protein [Mucilaginibacter sp. HD30]
MSNITGSGITFIGYNAGTASASDLFNATAVGYNAQATASNTLILGNGANVGIGTTTPATKLDVQGGNASVYNTGVSTSFSVGSAAVGKTSINLITSADAAGYGILQSVNSSGSTWGNTIVNPQGGNVGIGTASPDEKLTVDGKIHSKEVKVDLSIPVPDYVFEPEYKLTSLDDLRAYVNKNRHLPEIPSAAHMEKEGIMLSEMNMKLLKKVEELTLYLLEQQVQLKAQADRIKKLEEVSTKK